ncbi:guanine-N1-methyltransferase [Mycotypha africana]|uniref:guanine-N1-methyltransferase n=1 Tax=Mycotypha africana TaxID=64632 RepID=UPI0023009ACC|nr:guanine-N1-methyltransferase [Mycotypha africana]KAI8992120.1 guanine-N1-methyltransferase [Mycotypha africana]
MTVGNIGAVLDCSFSDYMNDKEVSSLRQQIIRTYSANVRAGKESLKLAITSFDDILKKHMDDKAPAWQNWKNIKITSNTYLDEFKKEDLVYLTADSDNVIHDLEEGKTYIIGGIVDKNRYKNLCKDKADKEGITTGQLPIGDHLQMSTRKVLTVNQVFEIMVKWVEHRDWEKAFLEVIPGRKLKDTVVLNQENEDAEQDDSEKDEHANENSASENQGSSKLE